MQTRRDFPEIVAICDGLVADMVRQGIPLDIAKASVKIVKLERVNGGSP